MIDFFEMKKIKNNLELSFLKILILLYRSKKRKKNIGKRIFKINLHKIYIFTPLLLIV